jgi:hypothetical protein
MNLEGLEEPKPIQRATQAVLVCRQVMVVVEQYAPTRRWRMDTLITMLS